MNLVADGLEPSLKPVNWRQRARIPNNTPVIEGRHDLSIFGDWIWVLGAVDHHDGRAASQCVIDWLELEGSHPGWVGTLKELCWHRLNTRLPSQRTIGVLPPE